MIWVWNRAKGGVNSMASIFFYCKVLSMWHRTCDSQWVAKLNFQDLCCMTSLTRSYGCPSLQNAARIDTNTIKDALLKSGKKSRIELKLNLKIEAANSSQTSHHLLPSFWSTLIQWLSQMHLEYCGMILLKFQGKQGSFDGLLDVSRCRDLSWHDPHDMTNHHDTMTQRKHTLTSKSLQNINWTILWGGEWVNSSLSSSLSQTFALEQQKANLDKNR